MMHRTKIAICGSTYVGKTTLLWRLSKRAEESKTDVRIFGKMDRMVTLNFESPKGKVTLFGATGSVVEPEKTLTWVFSEAMAVVYVVAPAEVVSAEDQNERFTLCLQLAQASKKTWDHIPWLIVLNRSDGGKTNPLADLIPLRLQENILKTIAIEDVGIDGLLKWVETTHSNQNSS